MVFFVGVPMGIAYPFSPGFKTIYIASALLCVAALVTGLKFRRRTPGKVAIIMALLGWTMLGLIGLSTGS